MITWRWCKCWDFLTLGTCQHVSSEGLTLQEIVWQYTTCLDFNTDQAEWFVSAVETLTPLASGWDWDF